MRRQLSSLCELCTVLQCADGRGTGGDDAAMFCASCVDDARSVGRESVVFCVEADIFKSIDAKWLEGSEPHMEGDVADVDAAALNLLEDRGGEVQPGCGDGDGAVLLCIDSLIPLAVASIILAVNVGWQRDVAVVFEQFEKVCRCVFEAQRPLTEVSSVCHFSMQPIVSDSCRTGNALQRVADLDFATRLHERLPIPLSKLFGEKNLDLS